MGTKISGFDPSVVLENPFGATPTMVSGRPLAMIVLLSTDSSAPNRATQ